MFSEDKQKNRIKAKWMIGTISACILVYLGIRYISVIANSITWLVQLILPILIGLLLAVILNIPLKFYEEKLFKHIKSAVVKRYLSILLSFISVLGILLLVLFLVVPELVQALITLVNIATDSIDNFSAMEKTMDYSLLPFGEYLENINVNWGALSKSLQNALPSFLETLTEKIPTALSSSLGWILDIFLGLIFSVYILAHKENFVSQGKRFLSVWFPVKFNGIFLHIVSISSQSFHNFIVGQTTEAIILGTLCTIGMVILQLPYAPTIGVLVGVTAFIPYVGAYLGAVIGFIIILTVNPIKAIVFLVFLVILQQVEGNIIYPKVVGNRINLPSFWVLAALTIGGNIAGPIGMILGVPICSAIYNLINEATDLKEQTLQQKEDIKQATEVPHE